MLSSNARSVGCQSAENDDGGSRESESRYSVPFPGRLYQHCRRSLPHAEGTASIEGMEGAAGKMNIAEKSTLSPLSRRFVALRRSLHASIVEESLGEAARAFLRPIPHRRLVVVFSVSSCRRTSLSLLLQCCPTASSKPSFVVVVPFGSLHTRFIIHGFYRTSLLPSVRSLPPSSKSISPRTRSTALSLLQLALRAPLYPLPSPFHSLDSKQPRKNGQPSPAPEDEVGNG
jgi:hypothetical protein